MYISGDMECKNLGEVVSGAVLVIGVASFEACLLHLLITPAVWMVVLFYLILAVGLTALGMLWFTDPVSLGIAPDVAGRRLPSAPVQGVLPAASDVQQPVVVSDAMAAEPHNPLRCVRCSIDRPPHSHHCRCARPARRLVLSHARHQAM